MANQTWFRLYTEVTRDRKLRRLSPTGRWLWITLLCLAKESPEPGKLLLSKNVPITVEDIVDEAGISTEDTPDPVAYIKRTLERFKEMSMLEEVDGVLTICHWNERQYKTDDINQYYREYYQKKNKTTSEEAQAEPETISKDFQNNSKTDLKQSITEHFGTILSDTDTDTDKRNTLSKESGKSSPSNGLKNHPAIKTYREVMHLFPKEVLFPLIAQKVGQDPQALDLWREVCLGWLSLGWNPQNVKGLLEHFDRKEIPGARAGPKLPKMSKNSEALMQLLGKEGNNDQE